MLTISTLIHAIFNIITYGVIKLKVKTFCTAIAKLTTSIDRPSVHQHLIIVEGHLETVIRNVRCPMRFVHFARNPVTL